MSKHIDGLSRSKVVSGPKVSNGNKLPTKPIDNPTASKAGNKASNTLGKSTSTLSRMKCDKC